MSKGSRKPLVYLVLALLIFGAFFSTFSFISPAKKAKAAGNTYYVDCDVGASGNGLSWATAKKTITEGKNLATTAGDTVEISGCVYHEYVVINSFSGTAGNYITFKGSTAPGHNSEAIYRQTRRN